MPNGTIPIPSVYRDKRPLHVYAACREAGYPTEIALPYAFPKLNSDFLKKKPRLMNQGAYIGNVHTMRPSSTEAIKLEIQPVVREAVLQLQRNIGLTRDDIIAGMMDAVYAAQNSQDLVAAWREIGRLIGAYAPSRVQIEHTSNTQLLQRISMLPDDELVRLIHQPEIKALGRD